MDRRDFLMSGATAGAVSLTAAEARAAQGSHGGARHGAWRLSGRWKPRHEAALKRIGAYAALHVKTFRLPGMTLGLCGPDGLEAFVSAGYADLGTRTEVKPDQLFHIGSISKSFIAAIIHQLAAEGKLALSDDIRQHLVGAPLPEGEPITFLHLLSHSSGLPEDAPIFPATPDGKLWLGYKPGSSWSYSNLGYQLLGLVIETKDGRKLAESLKARIFTPLGMKTARGVLTPADRSLYATGYNLSDPDADYAPEAPLFPQAFDLMTYGAGCVGASAREMILWMRWVAGAGNGKGGALMSDAAAANYARPIIAAPGWAIEKSSYGSGLAHVPLEGRMVLQHTGGMPAFHSSMHVDPKAEVGAFVSVNSGAGNYRPRDVSAFACAALRAAVAPEPGLDPRPAPVVWKAPPKPKLDREGADPGLQALAGRYSGYMLGFATLEIVAVKGGLAFADGTPLERTAAGYWKVKDQPDTERMWFMNLVNGRPQSLSLSGVRLDRMEP